MGSKSFVTITSDVSKALETLRQEIPDTMQGFGAMARGAMAAGALDEKTKELITSFNSVLEKDALGFYPDWPTSTFYDELNSSLQELVNRHTHFSQIAKALRMSAEVLYVRAGILEPGEASQVHHAIIADTAISERQKQVLLDIYTSFCQQNEAAREGSPTE